MVILPYLIQILNCFERNDFIKGIDIYYKRSPNTIERNSLPKKLILVVGEHNSRRSFNHTER